MSFDLRHETKDGAACHNHYVWPDFRPGLNLLEMGRKNTARNRSKMNKEKEKKCFDKKEDDRSDAQNIMHKLAPKTDADHHQNGWFIYRFRIQCSRYSRNQSLSTIDLFCLWNVMIWCKTLSDQGLKVVTWTDLRWDAISGKSLSQWD